MQPETVKIVADVSEDNPLGYIVINKNDLTDEHKLFDEASEVKPPKKAKKDSE